MPDPELVERFLNTIRQFLDDGRDGNSDPIFELPFSFSPQDEGQYHCLSIALYRTSSTIEITNIRFGDYNQHVRIFPQVMRLIEQHPSVKCVVFRGIKIGNLIKAGITKHGYEVVDDGENAVWHKAGT
jgi:hypothetical protein